MASVLAIISRAIFDKQVAGAAVGVTAPFDRYSSKHKALSPLADGGALFLVTVRPPDERLWLVGILESPEEKDDGWHASTNRVPITDITAEMGQLSFKNGKGIQAKKGALGMSLQTPRELTEDDAKLLRSLVGASAPPLKQATPARELPVREVAIREMPVKQSPVRAVPAKELPVGEFPQAVKKAFVERDAAAALIGLLDWWRASRDPAIADLIDKVSARIVRDPITRDQEWSKVALAKDPLDVGRLIAAIEKLPVSFLPTAADLFSELPDDPRISGATAKWIKNPPTTSSSTYPFWTKVLGLLVRSRDKRALKAVSARLAEPKGESTFWPKFYAALDKTAAQLTKAEDRGVDPLSEEDFAGLDKLVGELVARSAGPATSSAKVEERVVKLEGPLLSQARVHLVEGRTIAAIDCMLEAWRAARAPELADLIDRATRLLPLNDMPIAREAKKSLEPWLAAADKDTAASLPQLIENINVGSASLAEQRLARLGSLPDDPRVALRLAELTASHAISPERTQYWKTLLELIARIRDVRTAAPLVLHFNAFRGNYYDHHRQAKRIVGDFAQEPGPNPRLSKSEQEAFGALESEIERVEGTSTERKLLAAMAHDWDDPAAREVYIDWLMQRGHPRGELLAIESRGKREGALAKRYDELLAIPYIFGPLDDLAGVGDYGKRRGADVGLSRRLQVSIWASPLTWRRVAAHPFFAIIREIQFQDRPRFAPSAEQMLRVLKAGISLARVQGIPETLAREVIAIGEGDFVYEDNALKRVGQ